MKTILYYCLTLLLCISVCNDAEAKKKKYPNGDVYEGEWKSGKPEGKGKMIYANGEVYEGEWRNGQREGVGKIILVNGTRFEGNWKNGLQEGKGKMIYANGDVYEGEWKNGKDSHGKMVYVSGTIYEGEWKNNQPNGQGKITYANGGTYEGEWFMGKFFGIGKMVYPNGDIYEGEWKNGREEGKGKMIYANGDLHEGEWKEGKFFGVGKKTYPNGDIYKGEWKNGKYDGKGKMIYANGDLHEGEWKEGKFFGVGKKTYPNGDIYKGEWKNGKYDGKGKMIYANGDVYEGEWREGKNNGKGQMVYANGNLHEGEWKEGKIIQLNHGIIRLNDNILMSLIDSNFVVSIENKNNTIENIEYPLSSLAYTDIQKEMKKIISDISVKLHAKNLHTYRGEDYSIKRPYSFFEYTFDNIEYQYYVYEGREIKHGEFHLWDDKTGRDDEFLSIKGNLKHGLRDGEWIFEKYETETKKVPTGESELRYSEIRKAYYEAELYKNVKTGRFWKEKIVANYKDGKLNGLCSYEKLYPDGSICTMIKTYYKNNNHYNKKYEYHDVNKYYDESKKVEMNYDENGKLDGNLLIKDNDIELREVYQNGLLIKSVKKNIKKNVVLTPKMNESNLSSMDFKIKTPASKYITFCEWFLMDYKEGLVYLK